jgi:uncharacterized protein
VSKHAQIIHSKETVPMPRLAILALAAVLFASALAVPQGQAQMNPGSNQPEGISVLGEGVVLTPPAIARITMGVEVSNLSLASAQQDAAGRADAIVQQLLAAGISESDIQTVSFNIHPEYDQNGALRGFRVLNLMQVRTTDLPGLGALLDSVVEVGATRIHGIRFEADNLGHLKSLARDQAMQNARAKAEQLASNAGVSLGRALYIEESDLGGVDPIRVEDVAFASPGLARVSTPIQPGELQVRTIVRVVWAIQ